MPSVPPGQVSPYPGRHPIETAHNAIEDQRRPAAHRARGPPDPAELLDATAAAELLHVQRSTLASWRARGKGPPYYKVGRTILYHPEDLRAWLAAQRQRPRDARA
jgi:hypothetical protein